MMEKTALAPYRHRGISSITVPICVERDVLGLSEGAPISMGRFFVYEATSSRDHGAVPPLLNKKISDYLRNYLGTLGKHW